MGEGGGSAERKAEKLGAARDPAAGAWAAGAEGERRLASELANLREAWTALHDRLLRPGRSEANLDHVVVGPAGVFLIDAKYRAGHVAEYESGLYQHVLRDGAQHHISMADELRKVHGMAAYMSVETDAPVVPVLCLAGPHAASFGDARPVRGVWVVPISQLVMWLESRPQHLDRGTVERRLTRAMTDFPSTTTDPELLSAIGRAAAGRDDAMRAARLQATPRSSGRSRRPSPQRRSRSQPRRLRSLFAALAIFAIVIALALAALSSLGRWMSDSLTPDLRANPSSVAAKLDCSRVTASQVSTIVGRTMQPVVTSLGCAWGTRLDDSSTTVVAFRLQPSHAAYEMQLVTSVTQHRVVYGTAPDAQFRPGTALWVARDQPIGSGSGKVTALADTQVIVSTVALKLTDDQGRAMALAIAKVANSAP